MVTHSAVLICMFLPFKDNYRVPLRYTSLRCTEFPTNDWVATVTEVCGVYADAVCGDIDSKGYQQLFLVCDTTLYCILLYCIL